MLRSKNISAPVFAWLGFAFILANAVKVLILRSLVIWTFTPAGGMFIFSVILLELLALWFFLLTRKRPVGFVVFYCLQLLYMAANLWYFLYFRNYPSISQFFGLFGQGMDLARYGAIPFYPQLLFLLIDIPFFAVVSVFYGKVREGFSGSRKMFVIPFSAVLFFVLVSGINNFSPSRLKQIREDLLYFGDVVTVRYAGLPVLQAIGLLKADRFGLHYSDRIFRTHPSAKKLNIILVQIEAMDAFIVGQEHDGNPVMPFLKKLAGRCLYFPYMMTYHEGGGTSDCEFSLINSVEPLADRPAIMWNGYGFSNSMAKRLKKSGYRVEAFHGNTGKFWNRTTAFLRMGYDAFVDTGSMGMAQNGWGIPDRDVFSYVLKGLKTGRKPYFYHIITMSSHEPFVNVPRYYTNAAFADIEDTVTRRYYISMNYVDKALNEFVNGLSGLPGRKDTCVLIYGDHRPIDMAGRRPASFSWDGREFEFVPLFIVTPDRQARREQERVVSLLDIAPTVLSLANVKGTIRSDGCDLLYAGPGKEGIPFQSVIYDRSWLFRKINQLAITTN